MSNIGGKKEPPPLISTTWTLSDMLGLESRTEAAFNQKLNAVHPDPHQRRLIKFLPLQTVAKRENPFPAIYCRRRRSVCCRKEKKKQKKPSAGFRETQRWITKWRKKQTSSGYKAAVKKQEFRFGTWMIFFFCSAIACSVQRAYASLAD